MKKMIATSGTLLLLGLTTQAHAGEYMLVQNNGWSLVSASAQATVAGEANGSDDKNGYNESTFRYNWQGDNATDLPQPVKVTLGVELKIGTCFCSGPDTSASSSAEGSFKYYTGAAGESFSDYNHVSTNPVTPALGFTEAANVSKSYGGFQQSIIDSVSVSAWSSAESFEPDPTAFSNAGGASAQFTSINITPE